TTLVLLSDERKADAKDPLIKAAGAAGAVCLFSPLSAAEAERRLKEAARSAGKELSEEAAELLVAEAGTDWGILSQELEKALLYAEGSRVSRDDALQCLGYQKAADPFALGRLVAQRQLPESLAHFRRFLKDG